jgi:hypothetical protein
MVAIDSSTPTLADYAAAYGLSHRTASLALPKATQLMRHGFLQEVRSVARGDLPGGIRDGWLAQLDYAYEGRGEIERSPFTLVLTGAAASAGYAVRVLCHDRGLGKRDRANPDHDRQVVKLDDRGVRLESDSFLDRYAVSTDADQDQLAVWQLFSPGLIDWLTTAAPTGFSFELQDGALCCFVPGYVAEPGALDALCAGAARVFARVEQIDGDGGRRGAAGGEETRLEVIDRELAEHPFDRPPQSVKAAAKAFRRGLLLGDQAWALGAEAFFRSHAAAHGFAPLELSDYRAGHLTTALPGVPRRAAVGHTKGSEMEAFLVLTDSEDFEDMGWSNLVVDLDSPLRGLAAVQRTPRGDSAVRGSMMVGTDGRSLILSALDGGPRERSAAELEAFLAAAAELVAAL